MCASGTTHDLSIKGPMVEFLPFSHKIIGKELKTQKIIANSR